MEERNSEGWFAKLMLVVGFVITGAAGAVEALAEGGLGEHWEGFAVVVGIFAFASKLLAAYTSSRPGKTVAVAEKVKAEAQLEAAKALNRDPQ